MRAAEVTKSLRDRSRPALERIRLAEGVVNETVDLFLPQKPLVIGQWALEAVAGEASLRALPEIWTLLGNIWDKIDRGAQLRLLRISSLVKDICAALDEAEDHILADAIAPFLAIVAPDLQVTGSEAPQLVLSTLKNPSSALSEAVWSVIGKLELIFKDDALPSLVLESNDEARSAYLKAYFSDNSHEPLGVRAQAELDGILCSGVKVGERLERLLSLRPELAPDLLHMLESYKPLPPLLNIVQSFSRDYDALCAVIELDPVAVIDQIELVFPQNEFPEKFVSLLLLKAAQFRRLPDILPLCKSAWLSDATFTVSAAKAVSSLSPTQVSGMLRENARILVPLLEYSVAAHPDVYPILIELLSEKNWRLRASILDVCPSAADSVDPASWISEYSNDEEAALALLRLCELRGPEGFEIVAMKLFDMALSSITRFAAVFDALATDVQIKNALTSVSDKQMSTFEEYPRIYQAAMSVLGSAAVDLNANALAAAGSLRLALSQSLESKNIQLILAILDTAPKLVKEITTEQLIECRCNDILAYRDLILRWASANGTQSLSKFPDNSFGVVATAVSGDKDATVQWAWDHISDPVALIAISSLPSYVPSVPSELGTALALAQPSEESFALFAAAQALPTVLSFYVYTGSKFRTALTSFCRNLSERELWTAALIASDQGWFRTLQHLSALFPRTDARYSQIITAACAKALTFKSDEFGGLVAELATERSNLLTQFSIEAALEFAIKYPTAADAQVSTSRILLFQRHRLRGRMHLVIRALASAVLATRTEDDAERYVRLVTNLVSPTQNSSRQTSSLTSAVAQARRWVAKLAGPLLYAHSQAALEGKANAGVYQKLEPAAFAIFDVISTDELPSVSAGLDGPARTYLRQLYEKYKSYGRWRAD